MTRILIDYSAEQTADNTLKLNFSDESFVTPEHAIRKANGYLGMHVSMGTYPKNPVLIWSESPMWKMDVWLRMRGRGDVIALGVIEVDAVTGQPAPFSEQKISEILERANAAANDLPPAPATIG